MRRKLAAAVLAAGMLTAVTACGGGDDDDGGGGQSTEALCEDLNATLDPLEADLTSAMQEAGLAAGQDDDAALAEAVLQLNSLVTEVNTEVRGAAEDAADDEFRTALETFATELENLSGEVESGNVPDPQGIQAAGDGVAEFCG